MIVLTLLNVVLVILSVCLIANIFTRRGPQAWLRAYWLLIALGWGSLVQALLEAIFGYSATDVIFNIVLGVFCFFVAQVYNKLLERYGHTTNT